MSLVLSGVVLGLVSPATAEPSGGHGGTARTDTGWVKGTTTPDHRLFQGIPYAAPPVGELRWHSPEPAAGWDGVRDATRPGNRCPQNEDVTGSPASDTEDCLYLDVVVPRSATQARPKPVIVWLHGGGLMNGAGSDYDATRLAVRGDVVVVTVNYRLGNLGFFGFPGLPNAGAFGIEDQQAALRWVQRNATAFGGDPTNVTLMGQSAGSHSVCTQLASPSAAGLFHRAIAQSSPCGVGTFADSGVRPVLDIPLWVSQEWHDGHGQTVAEQVGCTDPALAMQCLREAPVAALLAADPLPLPGYGNAVLPEDPTGLLAAGRFNRVPVLTGMARDDGTMFAALLYPPGTAEEYYAELNRHFGEHGPAVAAAYPPSEYGDSPLQAMAAVMSDLDWAFPQADAERTIAKYVPTFGYEFLDRTAPPIMDYPDGLQPLASHGAELAFLFGLPSIELTGAQRRLGDRMIAYWARFAATGDPNRPGLPAWHSVDPASDAPYVQGLDLGHHGIGGFDRVPAHLLTFWADLVGR